MVDERRTLILVDLDNLAGDGLDLRDFMPSRPPSDRSDWLKGGDNIAVPVRESESPACVVAVALNTDTAVNATSDLPPRLQRIAERLAHYLGGSTTVALEIGLTLSAPQAVDALLERLLTTAVEPGHAGQFHRVCALGKDGGLRNAITRALGAGWSQGQANSPLVTRWEARAAPLERACRDARPSDCPPAIVSEDHDVAVNNPALASWAATRSVDLRAELPLPGVALECRSRPAVLSQLGATLHSTRGMGRLSRFLLRSATVIGPCSPTDGLELSCAELRPGTPKYPGASPLGPGAVRFTLPKGTATSKLPLAVVQAASAVMVTRGGSIDVPGTLARVRPIAALGGDDVEVELGPRRGRELLARVVPRPGRAPIAWWVIGGKAKSETDHAGLGNLLEGELQPVAARCAVWPSSPLMVVLRAPPFTGPLTVHTRIAAGRLGVGFVGTRPLAVLAPRTDLAPGIHRCVAIQDAHDALLRANHPGLDRARLERLCALPLVLPESMI